MSRTTTTTILERSLGALAAAAATAVLTTAPANADVPRSPCTLVLALVCRLIPVAPDLDDDLDFTTQPQQTAPSAPGVVSAPPSVPEEGRAP